MILELYSTRVGTATPNPNLGPERATNIELGWSRAVSDASVSAPASPYIRTYSFIRRLDVSVGFRNLLDDDYQLAWGYPQPGRTFHMKTRVRD